MLALDLMGLLEGAGFEVLGVAESGEQALVLANVRSADVVLMDVNLSGGGGQLDGIETAALIFAAGGPSIVFVTGEPEAEVDARRHALAGGSIAGAVVLAKPYSDAALLQAVRCAA